MNKVQLLGRLTRDPEVRRTDEGLAIATFSVAIDRGKDRNGNDRGADFPRVVVYGRQAENAERYLGKGGRVAVEGHIKTGSYNDREGKTVYTTDVVAERVEFIDWKSNDTQDAQAEEYMPPEGYEPLDSEDLPF